MRARPIASMACSPPDIVAARWRRGNTASDRGGGIFNDGGTLTLEKSEVSGNTPNNCSGVVC